MMVESGRVYTEVEEEKSQSTEKQKQDQLERSKFNNNQLNFGKLV